MCQILQQLKPIHIYSDWSVCESSLILDHLGNAALVLISVVSKYIEFSLMCMAVMCKCVWVYPSLHDAT